MKNLAPSPQPHTSSVASGPVAWLTKVTYPERKYLSTGFKIWAIVITSLVLLFILLYILGCYYSGNWCFHVQPSVNRDVELGGAGEREEELQSSSSSSD